MAVSSVSLINPPLSALGVQLSLTTALWCPSFLVLFRHLFYLPSHGNSWPCFCAGSRAFNYCKPLITDLTQINCSSQSVVPTAQFLEISHWKSVLNAADTTEFFLHWICSSMNLKIRPILDLYSIQACRRE